MAGSEGCNSNKGDIYKNIGIAGALVTIALLLKKAFKTPKRLPPITKEEILIGVKFREGLSAIDIASRIIERKKEIGINITPLPSGAENIDLKMEVIRVEEIVDAIHTKMKVEAAFPPGVAVTATGGNAGGPIVVQGATTQAVKVEGIAR
jgi:hypothetical protein